MTAWLVAVALLVSGSALADETPVAKKPAGPSRVVEAPAWEPPARPTTKVPGIDGDDAVGIVIETDPGGDARPWPYGAWIKTPEIHDDMVLELGTDRLPGQRRSDGLAARLSRGLDDGVGKVLELVLPPAKLVR